MTRLYSARGANYASSLTPGRAEAETPDRLLLEPSLERRVVTVRCPACRGRQRRTRTGWTKWILAALRIRPHRCEFCGHRFADSAIEGPLPNWTQQQEAHADFSTFLKPADSRGFRDVIHDLARDEAEQARREDERAISERHSQAQSDRHRAPWRRANFVSRKRPHAADGSSHHTSPLDRKPFSEQ